MDLVERIQVEGHADKRSIEGCGQIVPYRDNLQLSQNRARAVYNALLGLLPTSPGGLEAVLAGLPEAPPAPPGLQYVRALTAAGRVQVAGFGSTLPLDPDAPESEINRRVEIIVRFKD